MQRVAMVRYKVKPEAVAENEALAKAVFGRLHEERPEGIVYGLFKETDGVSFVHVFINLKEDNAAEVIDLPEFEAFTAGLSERCSAPMEQVRLSVKQVDSYGLAAAELATA
ncbi:MAG TPA: hypothetical protein VNT42_10840 [Sphingomonas sp.]|nr:hypothetical protein [Sphingomonas sp.]